MQIASIKREFDLTAETYDSQRRKFIPCFNDYYETSVDFLCSTIKPPENILDLGAGTGLLSAFLYKYYPSAKFTLADISSNMLEIAKKRFAGKENIYYAIIDYTKNFVDENFDLICSGLSIHHLESEEKVQVYKNIYNHLSDGGTFINLDQFNANTKEMNDFYEEWWIKSIKASGLSQEEYDKWLKRKALDRENTIDDTKRILSECGYKNVECIYKFMKFGVVLAQKT